MTTFSDLTLTAGAAWLTEWNALISRLTSFTGAFEGLAALSSSSVAIGTGTQAFTLAATSPFAVGAVVRARSAANSANYMVGTVTVSDGTDLSISVASGYTGGSGTISDWIISASWDGAATIANGLATAAVDMNGYAITLDAVTLSDTVSAADRLIQAPKLQDISETVVTANSGAAYTCDQTAANVFDITLTANCTYTFSNPPATGSCGTFMLIQTQDSTPRTVTWPASVTWAAGTAPTLSSGSGDVDIFIFTTIDGGTTWRGVVSGQDFA